MTIKEFMDKYNALNVEIDGANRAEVFLPLLKEIHPLGYIPYAYKRKICQKVIDVMYSIPDETSELFDYVTKNSAAIDIVYPMLILSCYTDLSVDWDDIDVMTAEYDELAKNNVINLVLFAIPEHERNELNRVLQRMIDDFEFNNCSVFAFIKNKIGDVSEIMEQLSELSSAIDGVSNMEYANTK